MKYIDVPLIKTIIYIYQNHNFTQVHTCMSYINTHNMHLCPNQSMMNIQGLKYQI